MELALLLFLLPLLFTLIEFIHFLVKKKRLFNVILKPLIELGTLVILPATYLFGFDETLNNCCTESATFSFEHKLTIYVLIGVCLSLIHI